MTAVVVVSCQEVACAGFNAFVESAEISVGTILWTADLSSLSAQIARLNPSTVVLDLEGDRTFHADRLKLVDRLRQRKPELPIVAWVSFLDELRLAKIQAHGVFFLDRALSRAEYLQFIQAVLRGEVPEARTWVRPDDANPAADLVRLTKRERGVLQFVAQGLSNKEIAAAIGISYETVKEHVQHILRKLNVSDRTQAAVWAVRARLV